MESEFITVNFPQAWPSSDAKLVRKRATSNKVSTWP